MSWSTFFLSLAIAISCLQSSITHRQTNNTHLLTIPELIESYGYPAEIHSVKTQDNYIITMHRIPYGKQNNITRKKPIVFLQHGFLGSSESWVIIGPDKGLGFLLADCGYDVWMGNSRGNTYSKEHNKTNTKRYWDFTMHEMGVYDLTANIEYILKETGEEELYYVGHSQGSPAVYMGNISTSVKVIADIYKSNKVKLLERLVGPFEFLPHSDLMSYVSRKFCEDGSPTQDLCALLYVEFGLSSREEINKTILATHDEYFPAGSSSRQLFMYLQTIYSGLFTRFDYGKIGNQRRYSSSKPPSYNISSVTVPVYLYYGEKDSLVVPKDAIKLAKEVTNLIEFNKLKFAHEDFLYGLNVKEYVYNHIISTLDGYSSKN